jgi:hypothetical protein
MFGDIQCNLNRFAQGRSWGGEGVASDSAVPGSRVEWAANLAVKCVIKLKILFSPINKF